MAQACNPSTLGGRGRWITRSRDWDHPGQHGETPSLLKMQKISWAWWRVPVIPATLEAEAGELPEPRRRRLQWAEIGPLHSSLGNKSETPSWKKKKEKKGRTEGLPRDTRKHFSVMHIFIILIVVMISWIFTCMKCIKLHTLNICNLFYVNYISIKPSV